MRAVLAAGGWAHPGTDLIAAVRVLVDNRVDELVVVTDPDRFASELQAGCDLLIVGACWFAMNDERYNAEQRRDHAVQVTPRLEAALAKLHDDGCPLLALHTAVICFDALPVWRSWLGGSWDWAASWHPEPGEMQVVPSENHELTVEGFTVTDELYQSLQVDPEAVVVAASPAGDPLVWLHNTGRARCAVNVLGHDRRSLDHPDHQQLNAQLVDWLLG